jgi:hypothetical protein
VSEIPNSGTLTVEVRSPQAENFVAIDDNNFDLTKTDLLKVLSDPVCIAEFRFTPDGFDNDKTYNVIIASGV